MKLKTSEVIEFSQFSSDNSLKFQPERISNLLKFLNQAKNEKIESKCGWTPFNGDKFRGTPTHTIIAGNIKMKDGKILGDPDGKPLKFA